MPSHTRPLKGLVGDSPAMLRLTDQVRRLGSFDLPVLVLGETGSGKELVARALHATSLRRSRAFVAVNCGAVDAGTAMSMLFGHERGAFTGATGRRRGAFREAAGGTLFLDEVGELGPELQAALLRTLEAREVTPVGGDRPEPVDFRLVAATHQGLEARVLDGTFREDLFYRLAVTLVRVPALRARRDDIPALARHFLAASAPHLGISPAALRRLEGHDWPGNVRELRNVVLRATVAVDGDTVRPEHLSILGGHPGRLDSSPPSRARIVPPARPASSVLRDQLIDALETTRGNRTVAAASLGIARSTLYARLKRLGLG
jgi:DNA-binding NtrC family response regulator